MPIQDAISLAKSLVDTTIGFVKYSFNRPVKTVGGPVEIATITKHERFKWVDRKHYFLPSLNEEFSAAARSYLRLSELGRYQISTS